MTVHTGWGDIEAEAIQLMFNYNVATLKHLQSERCSKSTRR
jgi:hypothetical protein